MNFIGIIPARYASTRFPGKPLADIFGKPMIQHVYEKASKAIETVYVATDDERIKNAVEGFGGRVVMTSTSHQSGTDRCCEAVEKIQAELGRTFDVAINIQGDEPFIATEQLEAIIRLFDSRDTQIATLVKPFTSDEDIFNPNSPKVVVSTNGNALYFSRSAIPFIRGKEASEWKQSYPFMKHVGLYAYRVSTLREICQLPQSSLELAESLEQLRWLENGYSIRVAQTTSESYAIDTPEDLARVKAAFA